MATTTFSGPVVSTNGFNGPASGMTAGTGITAATGYSYSTSISKVGKIITTHIVVDVTGLSSSTTDLDIIGVTSAANCHLGQITTATNGIIIGGTMSCLETPATGVTDIDLYSATVGTGTQDALITSLTETALVTKGGAWAATTAASAFTGVPTAGDYLYLTGGAAGTVGTYTAGIFLIELFGYEA